MEVDFNGLRRRIANEYNLLVRDINKARNYEGHLLVSPGEIQDRLDSLRELLVSLLCLQGEGFESIIGKIPLDTCDPDRESCEDEEEEENE